MISVDGLGIAFVVLVLAGVGYFWAMLFIQRTDPQAPLIQRLLSLPKAFRKIQNTKLTARETVGWAFVAAIVLLAIVVKSLK